MTTGGSFTDVTEKWMYGEKKWTIVASAPLPNAMEGAAIVSIYNSLYLTG